MLENNNSNNTYLNIVNGKLSQTVTETTQGAVSRTNKNGKTVYEVYYTKLTGVIQSMKVEDSQFGKQLRISVKDGDSFFLLSMNVGSSYCTTLLDRIGNCDTSKELSLSPYSFKDDKGKTRTGTTIYQGSKIEKLFTKDNPMPDSPEFPDDWKDEDAMALFNIALKKVQIKYIDTLVFKPAPSKTNIEFVDDEHFEKLVDGTFNEDNKEVPF